MNEISSEEWYEIFEEDMQSLQQATAWRERLEFELEMLDAEIRRQIESGYA